MNKIRRGQNNTWWKKASPKKTFRNGKEKILSEQKILSR